jgi:two-component system, NtrC family, sensor kinase
MKQELPGVPPLKIAMVGGGRRCFNILTLIEARKLDLLQPVVVGVADINPAAQGLREARQRGIPTTADYRDLLEIPDLDLILELTGKEEVLTELKARNPPQVTILDYPSSRMLHDLFFFRQEMEKKEEESTMALSFSQALANATSEGVMVLDRNFRIKLINQEACRRAGLSVDEAQGKFCFQVSHQSLTPCQSSETPCPMQETLTTGKSAHALHEHRTAGGETHYCDISTYPLVNRQGEIVQVLEIFRDITQDLTLRVEQRAQSIKDDLARLVQEDKLISLGKLVASVAHEINNPIASILNFTKLILKTIREGPPSREDLRSFEKWLELSIRETARCAKIISNLLSFARQQSLEIKRLDLKELLDQVLLLTQHRMELSRIQLKLEMPEEPMEVWGDGNHIQQCFTNLVFNALEAMTEGGVLTIRGSLDRPAQKGVLEFSDTGVGIAPEILPHIFEPFFSTKRRGYGVGLGLSMVYGIVREHGGDIEAVSGQENGALFRLTLPLIAPPGR